MLNSPFRTGDERPNVSAPPLGRHTDELLAEAGYTADAVAALRERGVVA